MLKLIDYQTAASLEAKAQLVSPDGSAVDTGMITWIALPYFFKKDRLMVIYLGEDGLTLETRQGLIGPQFAGR